ncbi:TPA: hypothetical protein U2I61_000674 [Providencia rettgeri]|nr:hypothetical protein [Providencia rettgeri]
MSWKSQIEGLSLEQLRNFRDAINESIRQKEDEKKRTVWRVCGRWQSYGWFREDDYLGAVEKLRELAEKLNDDGEPKHLSISIEPEFVPESEYEDWFNES